MTKDQREIFAENLTRLVNGSKLPQSEIAKRINVSPQTFNTWIQGKAIPRMGKIQLLADYFKIEKSDLIEEKSNITISQGIKIPVLGSVPAGVPITAVEDILDYEEIPQLWANQGEFFALKIKGDSMEPRMQSGDVVIVRQQSSADSGDTVIVLINGDEATCKKLEKTSNGIMLISTNTKYSPMFFSHEEINELPVVILGKVVENRQKY
jgi:SOS-response transcriptional repressor, lexA